MAKDRGSIDLESGRLPIDWATEETLQALLAATVKTNTNDTNKKRDDDKKHNQVKADNKQIIESLKQQVKATGMSDTKQKAIIDSLSKRLTADAKANAKLVRDELRSAGATAFETKAVLKGLRDDARQQALQDNKYYRSLLQAQAELQNSMAGRAGAAAGAAAKSAFGRMNPLGDVSGKAAGLAAGMGVAGAGVGMMISSVEGFINATNSAMQSGFTFGDQLIETRAAVGSVGLNLQEFSEILATNGTSIRRLGDSGMDAQKSFTGLLGNVMKASREFGYFGFTSRETAEQLAPIVDVLAKSGMDQTQIASEAEKVFMTLNKEVLGLAKLTGQDRRELLRQVDSVRQDNVFQNLLQDIPGAQEAMDMVAANFGALGSQSDFFLNAFKNFVTTSQTGIYSLTAEQEALFQQYPELVPIFENMTTQLTTDAGQLTANVGDHMQAVIDMAAKNEDRAAENVRVHAQHGDSAIAASADAVLTVARETENLRDGVVAQSKASGELMSANDAAMMAVQQNIGILMNTLQSQILKLFGVENIEDLSDPELMEKAVADINAFGDGLVKFRDYVVSLTDSITGFVDYVGSFIIGEDEMAKMPDFTKVLIAIAGLFVLPALVSAAAGGITALFAMTAVVGALKGALGTLFSGLDLTSIFNRNVKNPTMPQKTPTSSSGQPTVGRDPKTGRFTKLADAAKPAGRFGKLGSMLRLGGKALPYVGTALGAGFGFMDEDYKEANYGGFDRAALGITEGFLDLFDLGQNALGSAFNYTLGTDFRTDYDMAGAFKETMTDPTVAKWMMDPIKSLMEKIQGTDTGAMSGYENMTQEDFINSYATPGAMNFSNNQSTPNQGMLEAQAANQPLIVTTETPNEGAMNFSNQDSTSLTSTPGGKQGFAPLNRNTEPGITKEQAAEMLRYLKMTAENTDQ